MEGGEPRESSVVLSTMSMSAAKSTSMWGGGESRTDGAQAVAPDPFAKFIFPVVAEACQAQQVKGIVKLFQFLYIVLQIMAAGMFLFVWTKEIPSYAKLTYQILFFGLIGDVQDCVYILIALVLVDVLTIAILLSAVSGYKATHTHSKWKMFILRYWHGHLANCLTIPNMTLVFWAFAYNGRSKGVLGVLAPVLSMLGTGYCIFHSRLLGVFFARCPFLTSSSVHSWRVDTVGEHLVNIGLICGFSCLFIDFDAWYQIIPRVMYIVYGIYVFFTFIIYMPFKGVGTNAAVGAAVWGGVLAAVVSAVMVVYEDLMIEILILTPWAVFVVLIPVFYLVMKRKRNSVIAALT